MLNLKIIHEFRNKKNNDLYGIFFSSGKGTFLEFFKNKKKRKIGNVFRHLCFEVKDIKKIRKKLISLSPTLIKRGKTDKILQFFVKDLEHNVVEFHQRDKRSRF